MIAGATLGFYFLATYRRSKKGSTKTNRELLPVLMEISEKGRSLLQEDVSYVAHDAWLTSSRAKIERYDPHYAHVFAQPLESRHPETARGIIGMRLKVLENISRDAWASGKLSK
jgi:hypothetical protein